MAARTPLQQAAVFQSNLIQSPDGVNAMATISFDPAYPTSGSKVTVTANDQKMHTVARVQLAVTGVAYGSNEATGDSVSVTIDIPSGAEGQLNARAMYYGADSSFPSFHEDASVNVTKPR
jgi:hypothetical protein